MTSGTRRTPGCSTRSSHPRSSARTATGRTRTWRSTARRKLIIGALDPRHDDVDQTSCPGIGTARARRTATRSAARASTSSPTRTRATSQQIGDFVEVPAGHTTSCIDDCSYVWTGGPARRDDLAYLGPFTPGGRGDGRPIWVTDLRNPAQPKHVPRTRSTSSATTARPTTRTTSTSTRNGFAWVSGRGGLLGYATSGRWRDPTTDRVRRGAPVESGAGRRRRHARAGTTASPSRRRTSSTTRRGRPNGRVRAAGRAARTTSR